jgi:hypothetical protein
MRRSFTRLLSSLGLDCRQCGPGNVTHTPSDLIGVTGDDLGAVGHQKFMQRQAAQRVAPQGLRENL